MDSAIMSVVSRAREAQRQLQRGLTSKSVAYLLPTKSKPNKERIARHVDMEERESSLSPLPSPSRCTVFVLSVGHRSHASTFAAVPRRALFIYCSPAHKQWKRQAAYRSYSPCCKNSVPNSQVLSLLSLSSHFFVPDSTGDGGTRAAAPG